VSGLAFECLCAKFAPTHFDSGFVERIGELADRRVTIRRGRWAQSYRANPANFWVRDFESDLTVHFSVNPLAINPADTEILPRRCP